MNAESVYLDLLKLCRNPKGCQFNDDDRNKLWDFLWKIATDRISTFFSMLPIVEQLSFSFSSFTEFNPPEIEALISKLKDSSIDLKQRIMMSAPLFAVFPFFTMNNAKNFIMNVVDLVIDDYPEELISLIDTIEVASIKPSFYPELLETFKKCSENKLAEATIVFAPIAGAFVDNADDAAAFTIGLFEKCIKGQKKEIIAAAFLAERLSQQYSVNPTCVPNGIFEKMMKFIHDDDQQIQKHIHKSMRRLIECGIFDRSEKVKALVDQFPSFKDKSLFFKLVSKYLLDSENISLASIEPIFEFALSNIENFEIAGYLLSIFTFFGGVNSDFLNELVKPILVTVHQIILQKKYIFYLDATEALFMISKCFGNEKISIFEKDVISVSEILDKEDVGLSLNKRANICQSISSLPFLDSVLQTLISFVNKYCQELEGNIIYPFCTTLISVAPKLSQEVANNLFIQFSNIAKRETDTNRLNAVLETLKKLYKVSNCKEIEEFINSIYKGELKYFNGLPFICAGQKSMILHFISIFIKKKAVKIEPILNEVLRYALIVPSGQLPGLFEIIINSIDLLTKDQCKSITDSLLEVIPTFNMFSEDNDEILATFDVISTILNLHPDVIDPSGLISILDNLIQVNSEEEEEESMDPVSLASAMNLICKLSLIAPEINDDLILSIIELIPFPQESNGNDGVISSLINMCNGNQKYKNIYIPILSTFAKLVTSNTLDQYKINKDNIDKMKASLNTAIKNDPTLERQITNNFSRQQLNKFKTIFK